MRSTFVMAAMILLSSSFNGWCQTSTCEKFKNEYQPQSTPEQTYQLELEMMKQGAYCHDLAIFDEAWQQRAAQNSYTERHKTTAQYFQAPSKIFQEGKYAVIYYPDQPTLGPVFLYRKNGKWILDRTSTFKYIHYEDRWLAYDEDYPYLEMLKTVFPLEERITAKGQKVYRPQ